MYLPKETWSFDKIQEASPERAAMLEAAPATEDLANAVAQALSSALSAGDVRFGMEEAEKNANDLRAIVQFRIGEILFDRFFNARTGYRAQFRKGWQIGLQFNADMINLLCDRLRQTIHSDVRAARLNKSFQIEGTELFVADQFLDSLNPEISKLWFSALLIQIDGTVEQLAVGLSGPKISLGQDVSWVAPYATDSDAWLDMKGAFVGEEGPYQPKDPDGRAKKLETCGVA